MSRHRRAGPTPRRWRAWFRRRVTSPHAALAADAAWLRAMRAHVLRALMTGRTVAPAAHCGVTPDTPACAYHLITAVLDASAIAGARRTWHDHASPTKGGPL